jgi:hypothetical protein
VCDPEDPVSVPTGTFPVTFLGGDTGQITVTSDTAVEFCKQNLFGNADKPFPFPPRSSLASEWLTDSQATLVNIYGITTLVLVIVYVVVVFGGTMLTSIMSLFKGMYKVRDFIFAFLHAQWTNNYDISSMQCRCTILLLLTLSIYIVRGNGPKGKSA